MESYITFTEPNFDFEWKAAKKYVEFLNLGKEDWIILAKSGKIIEYNEINIKRINNTNASKPETFEICQKLLKKDGQMVLATEADRASVEQIIASGAINLPAGLSYEIIDLPGNFEQTIILLNKN